MKLKDTFLVHETEKETMLVPTGGAGFSGIVRGNRTLGTILRLLNEETTRDEIVSNICGKYDASRATVEKDVDKALNELRRIGALNE